MVCTSLSRVRGEFFLTVQTTLLQSIWGDEGIRTERSASRMFLTSKKNVGRHAENTGISFVATIIPCVPAKAEITSRTGEAMVMLTETDIYDGNVRSTLLSVLQFTMQRSDQSRFMVQDCGRFVRNPLFLAIGVSKVFCGYGENLRSVKLRILPQQLRGGDCQDIQSRKGASAGWRNTVLILPCQVAAAFTSLEVRIWRRVHRGSETIVKLTDDIHRCGRYLAYEQQYHGFPLAWKQQKDLHFRHENCLPCVWGRYSHAQALRTWNSKFLKTFYARLICLLIDLGTRHIIHAPKIDNKLWNKYNDPGSEGYRGGKASIRAMSNIGTQIVGGFKFTLLGCVLGQQPDLANGGVVESVQPSDSDVLFQMQAGRLYDECFASGGLFGRQEAADRVTRINVDLPKRPTASGDAVFLS
ncbi:hypothetical protein CLF_104443 [Clonorchis sinensis]|uniref:Uncharacterized protein n=1 Tax=Clonorchis sinensis TaxID=79923 RepID=G7YBP3_CLOSI|nr:hypothetical protein CLF_104443 [Clonorchis sinensis]